MKMHNIRSIQGLLIVWLMAAALVLTACSHWSGPESFSAGRGRTHRLAKNRMNHFMGTIRYQQADAGDHYRLGRHFQQRGRHMLAIAEFSRTIDLDPQRAEAYNAMGVSYDQLRQFDLAVQCYRWAQILKPDFAAAHNNLGYSYLMQGKPEKAVAPLQQAVALQDRNTRFHNNLALAYRQTGQVETASAEFNLSGQDPAAQSLDAQSSLYIPVDRAEAVHPMENAGKNEYPPSISDSSNTPETRSLADQAGQAVSPPSQTDALENQRSPALPGNTGAIPFWAPSYIEIANGNGAYRMARHIGNYFKLKGFDVQRLSNADHFNYPRTRIFYSDGQRRVACTLSQMLFGPEMVCDLIYSGQKYGRIKILMGDDMAGLNDLFSGKLKIQVANGNGVQNMAQKLSDFLRTKGFYVVNPVNAEHFGYEFTQIVYPPGRLANARFLAREFPENDGRRLVEDDRHTNILYIIIGKDFTI